MDETKPAAAPGALSPPENLYRADDLLVLTISGENLELTVAAAVEGEDPGDAAKRPRRWVRKDDSLPARLVVGLPPQHIADEAFPEGFGGDFTSPVKARIAGRSRIAFQMPDAVPDLPRTLDALMEAMATWPLAEAHTPPLEQPTSNETDLEIPWRLHLSLSKGHFAAASVAMTHAGRTELWHARLVPDTTGATTPLTARAVWSPDQGIPNPSDPFPHMLPTATDRVKIAQRCSDPTLPDTKPVDVRQLVVSALGAWLDVRGEWEPSTVVDLTEWVHHAAQGRDQFVKVVREGFLFPLGHAVAHVEINERKFDEAAPGDVVAVLRHREFLVLREQVRAFAPTGQLKLDRRMPFGTVEIVTRVTPLLSDCPNHPAVELPTGAFVVCVNKRPFGFHSRATDARGRKLDFELPEIFVPAGAFARDADTIGKIAAYWTKHAELRHAPLGRQTFAFAPRGFDANNTGPTRPGDTDVDAEAIRVGAEVRNPVPGPGDADDRLFRPFLEDAVVVLPGPSQITGTEAPVTIRYPDVFRDNGFAGPNAGAVFAEFVKPADFNVSRLGDRVGGLAQPNMALTGLSRIHGPVAGRLEKIAENTFDPKSVFEALNPLILGAFKLSDIVGSVARVDPSSLKMPRFVQERLDTLASLLGQVTRGHRALVALVAQLDRTDDRLDKALALRDTLGDLLGKLESLTPGRALGPSGPSAAPADLARAFTAAVDDARAFLHLLRAGSGLPGPLLDAEAALGDLVALLGEASDAAARLLAIQALLEDLTLPREVKFGFEWSPVLQSFGIPGQDKPIFDVTSVDGEAPTATFTISVQASAKVGPNPSPVFDIVSRLSRFRLRLIGDTEFVILHFEKIEFSIHAGKKPDVDVVMGPEGVQFVGPLEFVDTLRDFIPIDGFSDPPSLDVDKTGIRAGFSCAIPSIPLVLFNLQNVSLGARFDVPFIATPLSVSFYFCTREKPFLLTVGPFGGGGFFGLTVNADGLWMLEAALEFGACLSLNLGVASGEVHIMAGVYYRLDRATGTAVTTLSGYFRIGGSLDILGLVRVSVELCLSLSYEDGTGDVWGRATLVIEIEILFFSASVSLTAERRFAGSKRSSAREEMIMGPDFNRSSAREPDPQPWHEYCRAFA